MIDSGRTILSVSLSDEDCSALARCVAGPDWQLHPARTCREARDYLAAHHSAIVICERDLLDGSWEDLLAAAGAPPVIVASRVADDSLWAEVLNLGGCDVLGTPFAPEEVRRALRLASSERARRQAMAAHA